MPTLEDTTIDFPVTTLSDLLEAEAAGGIAVGTDEDRYRKWAFLSTGAAGVLAVILLVVLITGTGGDGGGDGGGKDIAKPPGTESATLSVAGAVGSEIKPGAIASVLTEEGVIASGGTVHKVTQVGKEGSTLSRKTIEIYVQKDEAAAIARARAAQAKFTVVEGVQEKTTPTTAAPAPAEPAPAEQTPPATG